MTSFFPIKTAFAVAVSSLLLSGLAQAGEIFRVSPNQRISCSRILAPGKQQVIGCKSYAYVINSVTSEFYRCEVSASVTRDAKAVLKTESEGACQLKARIFPEDSAYTFDATETEPPNTNAFFGSGGSAIWVSDANKPRIKGCINLAVGVSPDVLKCVEMNLEN